MTTAMIAAATGTLYMIRADIDALQFRRWMGSRQFVDDDHAMHCLLTECFGGDIAPKPFRLIRAARDTLRLLSRRSRRTARRDKPVRLSSAIPRNAARRSGQQADAVRMASGQTAGLRGADSPGRASYKECRTEAMRQAL